ncbi:MAG TPA: UvrD-helicase domain-containing protein [Planctomycetota bacterium]|nr:UvrD-helicase domain-containing protein [Planctomycetota bacterium]
MESILEGLNPPQREAVETLHGPLLILAGAGSGKTRVVTRRIANLIANGVRPWQILAITFTNKAAGEMRQRVEDLLSSSMGLSGTGGSGASGVVLATFHSFCARLLRREAEHLGFSKDFTIFDEDDASDVIKAIVKELGIGEDKRFSPRNVRQIISGYKNQGIKPDDVEEAMYHDRILKQIYRTYDNALKTNQAMDFDDLLRRGVELFREKPDVLERYRERYRYVLVDEYQDTNACQYHLINLLGEKHRNVCATGDPDQSIYAWRGADVRNILSFERDFPEAKVVKLEQNYRSTKLILQAADAVIAHNQERKKKTLWTENEEGEKINLSVVASEEHEAEDIAREIASVVRDGRRYRDIAIFYRTNSQSRPLENALRNQFIPYQIVGGTAFYERREVKDALSYLRLIINPKDDTALRRIINVPRRGLGDSALELMEAEARRRNVSLIETLDGAEGEEFIAAFKPKQRQSLIKFARMFDKWRTMPQTPVMPIVKAVIEQSGLMDALVDEGEMERIDNVNELVNAAAVYDDKAADSQLPEGPPPEPGAYDGLEEMIVPPSLSGFLENSALQAPTDSFDGDKDHVTMMTLHMAKGLEFPVVFLTGMEEGLMPMIRSANVLEGPEAWGPPQEDPRAVEEERRLLYVGITRAREKLYISRAQFRRRFGRSEVTTPSRFLSEIPKKLLSSSRDSAPGWELDENEPKRTGRNDPFADEDFTDDGDEAFKAFEREVMEKDQEVEGPIFSDEGKQVVQPPKARRRDPALQTVVDRLLDTGDSEPDPALFEIGDRVKHAKFGVGTIDRISGNGLSAKVTVIFRDVGPKQLLLGMAKLEKI